MSQLTVYSDKAVVSMNYVLIRNIVMFAIVQSLNMKKQEGQL